MVTVTLQIRLTGDSQRLQYHEDTQESGEDLRRVESLEPRRGTAQPPTLLLIRLASLTLQPILITPPRSLLGLDRFHLHLFPCSCFLAGDGAYGLRRHCVGGFELTKPSSCKAKVTARVGHERCDSGSYWQSWEEGVFIWNSVCPARCTSRTLFFFFLTGGTATAAPLCSLRRWLTLRLTDTCTTLAKKIETGTHVKLQAPHAREITRLCPLARGCPNFFGQGSTIWSFFFIFCFFFFLFSLPWPVVYLFCLLFLLYTSCLSSSSLYYYSLFFYSPLFILFHFYSKYHNVLDFRKKKKT